MTWWTQLEPWLQPYAQYLYSQARGVSITSVRRSRRKQEDLYRRYLAGRHKYPVAPPGYSMHEYGLAWDMWSQDDRELERLGQIWLQMGGCWSPRDNVHFGLRARIGDRHVC